MWDSFKNYFLKVIFPIYLYKNENNINYIILSMELGSESLESYLTRKKLMQIEFEDLEI